MDRSGGLLSVLSRYTDRSALPEHLTLHDRKDMDTVLKRYRNEVELCLRRFAEVGTSGHDMMVHAA